MNNNDTAEDFYYDAQGRFVMKESYHLKRGYCCGNGCKHCPYDYKLVPEPGRTKLLNKRNQLNQPAAENNYGYEEPTTNG